MHPLRTLPLILLTCLLAAAPLRAQDTRTQDTLTVADSLRIPPEIETSTAPPAIEQRDASVWTPAKSPGGAVLRSAILPGWGQLYNESYWKVPIVVGLSGFLIYGIVSEHADYADYADQYAATITPDRPGGDLRLKLFREFYRDRRDTYAWWFLVTYLVQIADAFVDAHLYDFDVSSDMRLTLTPTRLSLGIRW